MTPRTKPIRGIRRFADPPPAATGRGMGGPGTTKSGFKTLEEVAEILHVTKQAVSQGEKKALRKLKAGLLALGVTA